MAPWPLHEAFASAQIPTQGGGEARDPQAGGLRRAACQHAVVADGMNALLSTHAPAFFVSTTETDLPEPPDWLLTALDLDEQNSENVAPAVDDEDEVLF